MIKAVIIEDESLVARELQSKISAVAGDVEVQALLPSLKTARRWFMQNAEPDLLFMDIQLGDGVSFELLEHFHLSCPIIFTTAYDEYAIRAFKVNGIDYLLKPIDEGELEKAISKCRALSEKSKPAPPDLQELLQMLAGSGSREPLYKEKFIVHIRHQWVPVNTDDIACFFKDAIHYLYTYKGNRYVLDFTTLEDIEELLDPRKFFRANRQSIVNIDAIETVTLHENQKLTLRLKKPLTLEIDISREKAPGFKRWFDR
ncbi:LytTR family DNA-binding domain-containing protein [Rhabdobacter roseus]|uniref:DNA-binding LytR/AlgR family response regulator n=1 Tax=Rhabdobacter roseus TaxID=1655419 RepID=A0A840TRV2_9BACT|nr:LytTR family DNA-binding domain-containing protein [Rhabdobacter roseus]MBB5282449.1 DNA-binding LytR/AlgR family response regulator [Rhabdobacter roseus]